MPETHIVTLSCADRLGIVHLVTGVLAEQGGNNVEAAQFNDASTGLFFMRVRFETRSTSTASAAKVLKESFSRLAETFGMRCELHSANDRIPTVLLLEDRRDDLQLAAAVRAVFQVDLEHALETELRRSRRQAECRRQPEPVLRRRTSSMTAALPKRSVTRRAGQSMATAACAPGELNKPTLSSP